MLDVRVNLLKNRLYLTLYRMHANKLDKSIPAIENAAKKLSPGFTCITRFVDTGEPDRTDLKTCDRLHQFLSGAGMTCVVHVGITRGGSLPQLSTAREYAVATANTLEAAERQLDLWEASAESGRLLNSTHP